MYPRTEYMLSEEGLQFLLDACRPVPAMLIGGMAGPSPQENANRAWATIGKEMGFDPMTVRPVPGKNQRFFTAIPSETAEARQEREAKEAEEKRQHDIARLSEEIAERQQQLDDLYKASLKQP